MDKRRAREIAGEWIYAHGERRRQVEGLYNHLANELGSLMPDESVVGVATVDGRPAVLAVAATSLLIVSAQEADDGVRVQCRRLGLTPRLSIDLTEAIQQEGPRVRRDRVWTYRAPGTDQPVRVETSELIYGGFPDERGPRNDEVVARAAAQAVGWALPGTDPQVRTT